MNYAKALFVSPPAGYGKSLRQHVVRESRRETLHARPAVAAPAAAAAAAAPSRVSVREPRRDALQARDTVAAPAAAAVGAASRGPRRARRTRLLRSFVAEAPATALTSRALGASPAAADPDDTAASRVSADGTSPGAGETVGAFAPSPVQRHLVVPTPTVVLSEEVRGVVQDGMPSTANLMECITSAIASSVRTLREGLSEQIADMFRAQAEANAVHQAQPMYVPHAPGWWPAPPGSAWPSGVWHGPQPPSTVY